MKPFQKPEIMQSYLRQWNKDGDYLELPPYPLEGDFVDIDIWANNGNNVPQYSFSFSKDDLLQLKEWCQSIIDQFEESEKEDA